VRYVLEGSVRKVGNQVRITGQLIDAQMSSMQDRVASSVAGVIPRNRHLSFLLRFDEAVPKLLLAIQEDPSFPQSRTECWPRAMPISGGWTKRARWLPACVPSPRDDAERSALPEPRGAYPVRPALGGGRRDMTQTRRLAVIRGATPTQPQSRMGDLASGFRFESARACQPTAAERPVSALCSQWATPLRMGEDAPFPSFAAVEFTAYALASRVRASWMSARVINPSPARRGTVRSRQEYLPRRPMPDGRCWCMLSPLLIWHRCANGHCRTDGQPRSTSRNIGGATRHVDARHPRHARGSAIFCLRTGDKIIGAYRLEALARNASRWLCIFRLASRLRA
jgi:hypothetical protein